MLVFRVADAMHQRESDPAAIVAAPRCAVGIVGQTELDVVEADIFFLFPVVEVIFNSELLRKVGTFLLQQRRDDTVIGHLDGLLSAYRLHLSSTVQQVPLRGELTHGLARDIIREHDDAATLEVAAGGSLRVSLYDRRLGCSLVAARILTF